MQNTTVESTLPGSSATEDEGHYYWRKNCPYLYDTMLSYTLEWPTLTLDWLPNSYKSPDGSYSVHKIVYGTHTSGQEPNYLVIAEVHLGDLESNNDLMNNESFAEYNYNPDAQNGSCVQFEVKAKLNHPGEVNKALHMPGHPFVITTRTVSGDILMFDYSKHESFPTDEFCRPQLLLRGHKSEGYAMDWECTKSSFGEKDEKTGTSTLVSGGSDRIIYLWDLNGATGYDLNSNMRNNFVYYPKTTLGGTETNEDRELVNCELPPPVLEPLRSYDWHKSDVNDLKWHPSCRFLFSSASDDKSFAFWDTRNSENSSFNAKPVLFKETHSHINCISFNEFFPTMFATGDADGIVGIWDSRNLSKSIFDLEFHSGKPILSLQWSRWTPNILSSGGVDGKVIVWDIFAGSEQRPNDQNVCDNKCEEIQNPNKSSPSHASPCSSKALFVHCGHTAPITGLAWNPNDHGDSLLMASSSEDNTIQFWQLADLYLKGLNRDDKAP
ncbi:hypothetical protein FG386_003479 [Cryptosporidium ryanae]|uniref:uncharacterized protein n=1 Tax=Cryptosporidium ryanae TaxID=515981 RepID=UPI00351A0923|nr:hypothetical protein FG386_003479 [Cryptosporidium ryanae]